MDNVTLKKVSRRSTKMCHSWFTMFTMCKMSKESTIKGVAFKTSILVFSLFAQNKKIKKLHRYLSLIIFLYLCHQNVCQSVIVEAITIQTAKQDEHDKCLFAYSVVFTRHSSSLPMTHTVWQHPFFFSNVTTTSISGSLFLTSVLLVYMAPFLWCHYC